MLLRFKATSICYVASLLVPFAVHGDLRYDETTEIKGGIMVSLGKFAGMFGANGLDKSTTSTYIKGDRLRTDQLNGVALVSIQLIQLDREQIMSLDHKKKTYTVMTFAEMKAQMEKAIASAKSAPRSEQSPKSEPAKPNVKVEPKISVKDTGETRVINGFDTRKVLLTLEIEGEDRKPET
ncbi:MAG: hypothetical protein EXQ58_09270 [Acidobacteria bacterium]|nr:hypothetical protein [Acidobacteriota bacterium]